MLPGRHGASLHDPLILRKLPAGIEWDNSIAFLDRDGVINLGSPDYVNTPDEMSILPGSAESIGDLRRMGFRICVVTNQSPIGRGLWGHDTLASIHDKMQEDLLKVDSDSQIDLILYSPHAPWEGSPFRKPEPGMLEIGRQLLELASKNNSLITALKSGEEFRNEPVGAWEEGPRSAMVGDRLCDMHAGIRYGIRVFKTKGEVGLVDVVERITDTYDLGDGSQFPINK